MADTLIFKEDELDKAAQIIKSGGTVVFPTETVYGLGADAFNEEAVKKIFEAKGRPTDNPLIVHVHDVCEIEKITEDFNDNAKKIAEAFMPGPITIILKRKKYISDFVTAGLNTVGIRCPKSKAATEFIKLCETPVAAPSANISGSVSATDFYGVKNELMGRVDAIIMGEECKYGIESTVVDMTGKVPVILRPGSITLEMLKEIIFETELHPSLLTGESQSRPASPGMKYKHYSPEAEVFLVYGEIEAICEWFKGKNDEDCLFMFENYLDKIQKNVYDIGLEENKNQMANRIFRLMKQADMDGYKRIYIPAVKEKEIGFSVMNRLKKSSGGKAIYI